MTGNQRSTFQTLTGIISVGTIVLLTACRDPQAKQVANAPTQSSPTALTPPPGGVLLPVPGTPILQNEQLPTIPIRGLTAATEPKNLAANAPQRPSQADPFTNTNGRIFFPLPSNQPSPNPASTQKVAKSATGKSPQRATTVKPMTTGRPQTIAMAPQIAARRTAAIPSFPQTRFAAPAPQPLPSISVPQLPTIATIAAPTPQVAAAPANAPVPPSTPQRLADAIAISGVLQTNGKTMVIAKSPNEQSARYVQAGDSIGAVRVKSIQVSRSGEPTVVLEQNGVEVTKSIGPGR